jgi:hypothetical protein
VVDVHCRQDWVVDEHVLQLSPHDVVMGWIRGRRRSRERRFGIFFMEFLGFFYIIFLEVGVIVKWY